MYCFFILLFSFDTSFTAGLKLVLGLGLANLRVRVTFQKVKQQTTFINGCVFCYSFAFMLIRPTGLTLLEIFF